MFAKEVYLKEGENGIGLIEVFGLLEGVQAGTEVALYRLVKSGTVEHKTIFAAQKRTYKKKLSPSSKGDGKEASVPRKARKAKAGKADPGAGSGTPPAPVSEIEISPTHMCPDCGWKGTNPEYRTVHVHGKGLENFWVCPKCERTGVELIP